MSSRISRAIISYGNITFSRKLSDAHRCGYSSISTVYHFPTTLLRLNAGVAYKQFWFEHDARSGDHSTHNHFGILKDNADVWTNLPFSDGATLLPNTFTMQEIIRTAVDNYFYDMENGVPIERPFIFTIPKGTPVPKTLVLLRERTAQFSLLSSRPTSSDDLNNSLDKFYSEYAKKQDAGEWLDDHNFEDAVADDAEWEWMAR
ncbi:hypothetical protein K469DRAFT_742674 [Zopfia rhizophila CBS 207.26]|uniref:Tse2 ADP-ribosyltransferase toxin domain-containing protein n=1 Tax=Zopfia rhizophila CBS 207.26 TaxID=1314779 RepID=A0A6A6DFZ3_9PEZI|nr:hypothetical protein K469DRAFT_742674 [Zopfia rhizophila CBS 207.26]